MNVPPTKKSGERDYDVEVAVRETWTIRVKAATAAEAEDKVRRGNYAPEDATPHGDRVFRSVNARRPE